MTTESRPISPSDSRIPLNIINNPTMGYATDTSIMEELSNYPVSWGYDLSEPLPLPCQLEIGKSSRELSFLEKFHMTPAEKQRRLIRVREVKIMNLIGRIPLKSVMRYWNFQGNALLLGESEIMADDIVAACACAAGAYTKKTGAPRDACKNTYVCPRCCRHEQADYESAALTAIKEQGLKDSFVTLSAPPIPMGDPHQAHAIWMAQMAAWDAVRDALGVVGGAYRYELALSRVFIDETRGFLRESFLIRPHLHLVVLSKKKLGRNARRLLKNALKEKLREAGQSLKNSKRLEDIKPIKQGTLKGALAYIRKPLAVISKDSAYSDMAKAIKTAFPDDPLSQRFAFLSLNKVCCDAMDYLRCCTSREFTGNHPECQGLPFKVPPRVTKAYGAFGILYGKGGKSRKKKPTKSLCPAQE